MHKETIEESKVFSFPSISKIELPSHCGLSHKWIRHDSRKESDVIASAINVYKERGPW